MSREIADDLAVRKGLVVAAGVYGELADQVALEVDHTDALIGDEELDLPERQGPAMVNVRVSDRTSLEALVATNVAVRLA
jgi:hypothetical protein